MNRAILTRKKATKSQLADALSRLAKLTETSQTELLLALIDDAQQRPNSNVAELGKLLPMRPIEELQIVRDRIEDLAVLGTSPEVKRLGYAAWIAAAGPDDAFLAASKSKDSLRDFLDAVPTVDSKVRGQLYSKVRPLIFDLPTRLKAEKGGASFGEPGIRVDYFYPSADNVAIETLAKMKPKESGVVPEITMNVPQRKQNDKFALRFTGFDSHPCIGQVHLLHKLGRWLSALHWRPVGR